MFLLKIIQVNFLIIKVLPYFPPGFLALFIVTILRSGHFRTLRKKYRV